MTVPVFPEVDVPDEKTSFPEAPFVPLLALLMATIPDVVA
jgi:hypothetical protein